MTVACPNCDTSVLPLQLHGMPGPQCPLCGYSMQPVRALPTPAPRPVLVPAPDAVDVDGVVLPPRDPEDLRVEVRRLRDIATDRRAELRRQFEASNCIDLEEMLNVKIPVWALEQLLDAWEDRR